MDGSIPGWKPGLYYGADEQCKIAFGSVATACTFADSSVVGRKFVCLAKGSREMLSSQNLGEGAGRVFILKGSKVLFCHKFLGRFQNISLLCITSFLHIHLLQGLHSWVVLCTAGSAGCTHSGSCLGEFLFTGFLQLKSLCLGSTACLIAAIWTCFVNEETLRWVKL